MFDHYAKSFEITKDTKTDKIIIQNADIFDITVVHSVTSNYHEIDASRTIKHTNTVSLSL